MDPRRGLGMKRRQKRRRRRRRTGVSASLSTDMGTVVHVSDSMCMHM